MPPRIAGALPLLIPLDSRAAQPLHEQIYSALRQSILGGRLKPGTRLPSSRALAAELEVARNTVLDAFERLSAEGYIEGRAGGGTRVALTLPEEALRARRARPRRAVTHHRRSSHRASITSTIGTLRVRQWSGPLSDVQPFRLGALALSHFPMELWSTLMRRRWRQMNPASIDYGEIAGYRPLRESIAAYLRSARGVSCEAAQVLIVNGSQQGLDLASRIVLDPGDSAWIEEPGYDGARGALVASSARSVPVPVDAEGLNVQAGIQRCSTARMVFVTPSHQFPLGVTMSLPRRLELLRWAQSAGAWIFEDDYDSEFRYSTRPLPALQGLDTAGSVIYAGTFSKVLYPSLRIGYLVVPPTLIDAFIRLRLLVDVHPPTFMQAVLADFIDEGHFERHLRRMRILYRERQEALVRAVRRNLGGMLEIAPSEGGMHVVAWLPRGVDDNDAAAAAVAAGLNVTALSFFAQTRLRRGALLLGYAGFTPERIASGTQRLARALEPLLRPVTK